MRCNFLNPFIPVLSDLSLDGKEQKEEAGAGEEAVAAPGLAEIDFPTEDQDNLLPPVGKATAHNSRDSLSNLDWSCSNHAVLLLLLWFLFVCLVFCVVALLNHGLIPTVCFCRLLCNQQMTVGWVSVSVALVATIRAASSATAIAARLI